MYYPPEFSPRGMPMKIGSAMDLSRREREILGLIGAGHTSAEIAEMLYVSKHTVAVHRKNLCRKLKAHSTVALVRCAVQIENTLIRVLPPHGDRV